MHIYKIFIYNKISIYFCRADGWIRMDGSGWMDPDGWMDGEGFNFLLCFQNYSYQRECSGYLAILM